MVIEIDGKEYDTSADDAHIKVIEYNPKQLSLHLQVQFNIEPKNSQSIYIVSDLKFLVKNVASLLAKAEIFHIPLKKPSIQPHIPQYLNSEQKCALQMVLQSSFCYVWGAPGTGKTRAVLYEAIVNYIASDQQVVILAPTNSALEQILEALLPLLESIDFDLQKVIRLGTPSYEYASSYPQTLLSDKMPQSDIFATASLFEANDKQIDRQTDKIRIKNASIVASTIDTFILKRVSGDVKNHYEHIFLDEAGFAPMAKVATLFDLDTPVTLFGDHKQLSPICEVSRSEILESYNEFIYWDIPSIYLCYLYNAESFERLNLDYANNTYSFDWFAYKVDLVKTHRYGQNLCEILDKQIYHNGLQSSLEENSKLFYAHTPKVYTQPLENRAEAQTCKLLYEELRYSGIEDIGIITPFNNQKRLIEKELPHLRYESRVLTFHKSQGKEFHTLIISAVYKHRYLTDSFHQSAKQALNVAVSRAKVNLIIVCDFSYWMRFPDQFITQILHISQPFSLSSL